MGHSMKRKEGPRFIRGKGTYVDDVVLPGMLYPDIVRSPHAHARIVKIDSTKALAVPGVLAVITGQDLAKYNLHWMPTLMSDTQMVLPIEKVVYYAQEVCVVIATDRYIAADAIEKVQVEYEPLDPVVDPHAALDDTVLVREAGTGRATIITYVNPLVAVVLGVTLLGERPGPGALAGLALILAGSWLSTGGGLPPRGRPWPRHPRAEEDDVEPDLHAAQSG